LGIVSRFERRLQGAVGDGLARVFGGGVVPKEVEAELQREAADQVSPIGSGQLLAPNSYVIAINPSDYDQLAADHDLTVRAFSKHLADYIADQGWQTYGDIRVVFEPSPTLHTGQFRTRGAVDPDVGRPPPDPRYPAARPPANPLSGAGPMTQNSGYDPRREPADPDNDRRGRAEYPGEPRGGARGFATPLSGGGRGGYQNGGGYAPAESAYRDSGRAADRGYQNGHDQPAEEYQNGHDQQQPGYGQQAGYGQQGGYGRQGADYDRGYGGGEQGYGDAPGYAEPGYGGDRGGYGTPPAPPAPATPGYGNESYAEPGYGAERGGYGNERPGYGAEPGGYGNDRGGYGNGNGNEQGYAEPAYGDKGYGDAPQAYGNQQAYPQTERGYAGEQPGYGQQPAAYNERPGYGGGHDAGYAQPPQAGKYGAPAAAGNFAAPGPGAGYAGGYTASLQLDDGSGRTYQLREGSNIIGRGQDAHFRLPDTGVSRRHIEVRWDGQVAMLSDLGSTNGTLVNGSPVQDWQLADGDVIRAGHSEVLIRIL